MEDVHISVIIPVYGVEAYIGDCIASLKAQNQEGLEFIFVDDCSPDRSMAQVEAFAAADPRVRMIRMPENAGAGPARNRGIEAARGKYLSFIDPDDWVDPRFYSLLWDGVLAHPDCDIIKGSSIFIEAYANRYVSRKNQHNERIRRQLAQGTPLYLVSFPHHSSALYRAALFEDPAVRYGASRIGQDFTFLLRVCLKTQRIAFVDDALHYYRCGRPCSTTQSWTKRRLDGNLQSLEEKIDTLAAHGLDKNAYAYIRIWFIRYMNIYFAVLENMPEARAVEDSYRNRLRMLAAKLSDEQMLVGETPEIRLHLQFGVLIPLPGKQFQCERIRRWTRFIVDHPEAAGQYAEDYAAMLLQNLRMYMTVRDCELRKEGFWASATLSWKSLPSGFRLKVSLMSLRMIARKGLRRLCRAFGKERSHEK